MKVSIITVVLNCKDFIKGCIESVYSQTYKDIEHIVIDGGSTDGTVEVIDALKEKISKFVSNKGDGIYGGLNKGIKSASGDVIGILHSDDVYADNRVIEKIVGIFFGKDIDVVYGDLVYVKRNDLNKIVRNWKAGSYNRDSIINGWFPPHSSLFIKRKIYNELGYFDIKYRIAADYELMLRLLYLNRIRACCFPKVLVKMRLGGISNRSLLAIFRKSLEDYRILKSYGLGLRTLFLKNIRKAPQFFKRG